MTTYCETQSQVDDALTEIFKYPIAGLDTEFYGCDITRESPVGKSICHVFSVAVPSGPVLPRGFNEAESWVFPASALAHPGIKAWLEDKSYAKAVHNQPVDHHTLRNHGVNLAGGLNTLAKARFWYPHRAKREGFNLDSLGRDYCGAGKTEGFDDLLGYDAIEVREHEVTKKRCECGALSCAKKKMGADFICHTIKTPERVVVPYNVKVRRHILLADLHPGHSLWERYLAYAAWDAVLALWINQIMDREKIERPYPWSVPM